MIVFWRRTKNITNVVVDPEEAEGPLLEKRKSEGLSGKSVGVLIVTLALLFVLGWFEWYGQRPGISISAARTEAISSFKYDHGPARESMCKHAGRGKAVCEVRGRDGCSRYVVLMTGVHGRWDPIAGRERDCR